MTKNSRSSLILAGDVGGTKTRLGLFQLTGPGTKSGLRLLRMRDFPSNHYDSLEKIVTDFIPDQERIHAACFGVAGPVMDDMVVATNLPWKISKQGLEKRLRIKKISLLNDLVANAWGIEVMRHGDFTTLSRGRRTTGNRALLSAGTGLGEAILFWDGVHHVPTPSEGGHVEFGPTNRLDLELLRYLFDRYGHVSYERILSGSGLVHIFEFLRDTGKYDKASTSCGRCGDFNMKDAAEITEAARLGKSRICEAALDLFVSIYGAAAGNLALQVMATGGIYVGGGIAPKIIWKLKDGTFMRAFKDKGRLSFLVDVIPVKVIMNDRAALLGSAAYAGRSLEKG